MRILIASTIFPNRSQINRGIYILKQANELQKYAELKVISPLPFFPKFLKSKTYSVYSTVPSHDRIDGHDVVYPRFPVVPKVFQFLNGLSLIVGQLPAFHKIVKSFKPNFVLCFWAFPDGFANVVLSKMFGVPVVVGVLGSDINQMPKKYMQRKMIKWALSHSNRVLSVSGALKAEMVRIGVPEEKIAVIRNGIEQERFRVTDTMEARDKLDVDRDARIVVCVSRLSQEKGLDTLIRSFAFVTDEAARLVLVGGGGEEARLKALAEDCGVSQKVIFAGDQPHDDIPLWLSASDVLALPSRMEGCPNIVLEALACGKPVVASRVGGVPELITSDRLGFMVEPDDPEALAKAINRAFATDWQPEVLSSAVRDRTWDTVVREILDEVSTFAYGADEQRVPI